MEYIFGVDLYTFNVLDNSNFAKRTMNAIQHLAIIPIFLCQGPGPIGGGPAQVYLRLDNGT